MSKFKINREGNYHWVRVSSSDLNTILEMINDEWEYDFYCEERGSDGEDHIYHVQWIAE